MIACTPAMNSLSKNRYGYIYIYKGIYVYNIQKKICIYYRRRIYIYVYKSVLRQRHQRNPNINQEYQNSPGDTRRAQDNPGEPKTTKDSSQLAGMTTAQTYWIATPLQPFKGF